MTFYSVPQHTLANSIAEFSFLCTEGRCKPLNRKCHLIGKKKRLRISMGETTSCVLKCHTSRALFNKSLKQDYA
jgi:hypothetical protein